MESFSKITSQTREDKDVQDPENEEGFSEKSDHAIEQPSQKPEKAQSGHLLQAGLDSIEFVETREQSVSLYEAPPWVFLDDEEGWTSLLLPSRTFGASDGVLYAQGNDTIVLFSQQGQQMHANDIQQIRIRMNVTEGEEAYLLLKRGPQESFPDFDAVSTMDFPQVIRIPLQGHAQFHTYTIDMSRYVERISSIDTRASSPQRTDNSQETLPEEQQPLQAGGNAALGTAQTGKRTVPARALPTINISQFALVFPAVTAGRERQIAIDYIDVVSDKEHAPLLTQSDLPTT